jgi:hypothetical protein
MAGVASNEAGDVDGRRGLTARVYALNPRARGCFAGYESPQKNITREEECLLSPTSETCVTEHGYIVFMLKREVEA